jgi:hypothetical protein
MRYALVFCFVTCFLVVKAQTQSIMKKEKTSTKSSAKVRTQDQIPKRQEFPLDTPRKVPKDKITIYNPYKDTVKVVIVHNDTPSTINIAPGSSVTLEKNEDCKSIIGYGEKFCTTKLTQSKNYQIIWSKKYDAYCLELTNKLVQSDD